MAGALLLCCYKNVSPAKVLKAFVVFILTLIVVFSYLNSSEFTRWYTVLWVSFTIALIFTLGVVLNVYLRCAALLFFVHMFFSRFGLVMVFISGSWMTIQTGIGAQRRNQMLQNRYLLEMEEDNVNNPHLISLDYLLGVIHYVSLVPYFCIYFYSVLYELTYECRRVTLFMDSTASMAKSIEYPHVVKTAKADGTIKTKKKPRIFYYAVVVKSQSGKSVPILEFFSDKQDFLSIYFCMEHFFQAYKKLYKVQSFNYNVSRLEIDFSLASLSAATRVFAGQDVEQYLRSVWNALKDGQRMKFTVHICRIHTVKFLTNFFENAFKATRVWDKGSSYFIKWIHRFVAARTMDEVSELFEEVFMVLSIKYYTTEIEDILAGNFEATALSDWKEFNIRNIKQDAPFSLRTPFGAYLNDMADKVYELNNELEERREELPKNLFFNLPIMRYLREKMGPYAGLLSKVPFLLTDSSFVDDNTNKSETWNKIVKTDILQGQRHQKLSRVIRALATNVLGAVMEAHSKFPISAAGTDAMAESSDDSIHHISSSLHIHSSDDDCKRSTKADRDSPDEAVDQFKTERIKTSEPSSTLLREMELLPNGGRYKGTALANTCSFDCIIQALYYLHTFTDFGRMFIDDLVEEGGPARYLPSIFEHISKKQYSEAKAIWIKNLLKKNITGKCMDLWEEELEQGMKPLKGFFPVIQRVDCPNRRCNANQSPPRQLDSTYFLSSRQEDFEEILENGNKKPCKVCKSATARHYYNMKSGHNYGVFAYAHIGMERKYLKKFDKKGQPYYELEKVVPTFPESKLELSMQLFNTRFRVVCYTIYNGVHYKLVIVEPTHKLVYDGQIPEKLHKWKGPNDEYSVSTIWLTPIH